MNAQDLAIPHFPLLEELHVSTRAGAVPVQVFQWCSRARTATALSDAVRACYAAALALHADLAHARSLGAATWRRRAATANGHRDAVAATRRARQQSQRDL